MNRKKRVTATACSIVSLTSSVNLNMECSMPGQALTRQAPAIKWALGDSYSDAQLSNDHVAFAARLWDCDSHRDRVASHVVALPYCNDRKGLRGSKSVIHLTGHELSSTPSELRYTQYIEIYEGAQPQSGVRSNEGIGGAACRPRIHLFATRWDGAQRRPILK